MTYTDEDHDRDLSRLRALLGGPDPFSHREGEGDVTFTRLDGLTVTFTNVRVDSIGPGAVSNGTIGVEDFDTDNITHVPFVESWEISYRY